MKQLRNFAGCLFLLSVLFSGESRAQNFAGFGSPSGLDSANSLAASVGISKIGDETYVGMRFEPELSFGKLGIGFSLPLLFNVSDFSFRKEEYREGSGATRLFNYVRYGAKKRDKVYFRWGSLSGERLGFGGLINNYTNMSSFERRKTGLSYDVLIKEMVGLEGFYSDLNAASLNLFAIRPYLKPFGKTKNPILKSLEFGLSFVKDRDQTSSRINDSTSVQNQYTAQGVSAWGFDAGMRPVNTELLSLRAYVQFGGMAKVSSDSLSNFFSGLQNIDDQNFASRYKAGFGYSIGADLDFKFIANIFHVQARLERLFYTDYYLPQFFDASYEINKDGKVAAIGLARGMQGTYATVAGDLVGKIKFGGGILLPDSPGIHNPALVQLFFDASQISENVILRGSYVRNGITSLEQAFKLDENSLANVQAAVKVKKFVWVGMNYMWTYAITESGGFRATDYFMPYVGLSMPLFGSKKEEEAN